MELNRDQIVKALECCASNSLADCDCCPIDEQKKDNCECGRYLAIQALALIRKLTEENEILASYHKTACDAVKIDTVRKMKHELYEEFLKVANCQKAGEPNMRSQEVFAILEKKAKEMLEKEEDDA